jgi:hypothetical protein
MAPQILLVADSPGDVRLTKGAFREVNPSVRVHVANDSVEALGFSKARRGPPQCSSPRATPRSWWNQLSALQRPMAASTGIFLRT